MSETLQHSPVSTELSPAVGERDRILRELLPYDYEYAKDSGLFDMFDYDPDRGVDGLIHTLGGNLRTGPGGGFIAGGYHHEDSGSVVWPSVVNQEGEAVPVTRAVPPVQEAKNGEIKPSRFPYEPYQTKVVINQLGKKALQIHPDTGEKSLVDAKNTMYPKEYDPLMVLQAIRMAYDSRDTSKDTIIEGSEGRLISTKGKAVLLDGTSTMDIKLLLDPDTQKIRTAFPLVKKQKNLKSVMGDPQRRQGLTPTEVERHLYGPFAGQGE